MRRKHFLHSLLFLFFSALPLHRLTFSILLSNFREGHIFKAWFPYNCNDTCGTGGSVQGRVRLRYRRQISILSQVPQAEFNLVCDAAGTVQSNKRNLTSLCRSGVFCSSLARKQEANKQFFCQYFLLCCTQQKKKSSRT